MKILIDFSRSAFLIFTFWITLQIVDIQWVVESRVFAAEERSEETSWVTKILKLFHISVVRTNEEGEKTRLSIWLMEANGKAMRKLKGEGKGNHRSPVFSPDGRKIAYVYDFAVWLMNADSSSPQLVFNEKPVETILAWSQERSGELALLIEREGTTLWSLSLKDKKLKPIEMTNPETFSKIWINSRISLTEDEVRDHYYDDEKDWNIQIKKKGERFWKNLTETKEGEKPYQDRDPSWSPDGHQIIFASDR
jgi:dipeptidyl aminopeptidase/acylaminoacyl peptidase